MRNCLDPRRLPMLWAGRHFRRRFSPKCINRYRPSGATFGAHLVQNPGILSLASADTSSIPASPISFSALGSKEKKSSFCSPICPPVRPDAQVFSKLSNDAASGELEQGPSAHLLSLRPLSIMDRYRRARNEDEKHSLVLLETNEGVRQALSDVPETISEPLRRSPSSSSALLRQLPRRPLSRGPLPAEVQFASWNPPVQPANPRSLTVALIGAPNAGKSSLFNSLLGVTLSAVSNKVNTTRSVGLRTDFRGIVTKDNRQLVFIDAPGIIESHPKKAFCRELVSAAWRGYEDADLGILVVDAVKRPTREIFNVVRALAPKPCLARLGFESPGSEEIPDLSSDASIGLQRAAPSLPSLNEMRRAGIAGGLRRRLTASSVPDEPSDHLHRIPLILCLNKVDLASHPKWIEARKKEFESHGHFKHVFNLSAKHRRGTQQLLDYLLGETVLRPWLFPSHLQTNLTKTQQVEELIRTYLFCWFNKDVPYRIRQRTVGWANEVDGTVVIDQEVLVATAQVAKMICGVRGRIVLQMRKNVTHKLERLWGQKVDLHIHVRVAQGGNSN